MIKFSLWASILTLLCACSASLSQLPSTNMLASGDAQLARGIKAALELASTRASDTLARPGGYNQNPAYRITLPENIQPIAKQMRQFGLGSYIDQAEILMNKGAEQAASEAKTLFISAVRNMTITDALEIIKGDESAATRYFRAQTEGALRERYQPIIQQNLRQLGFYDPYQSLLNLYKNVPIANKPNLDLEEYAINQSLNALFRQVAEEEKLIRADPIGKGSQLIAAVFK